MTYATLALLTERFGERMLIQLTDRAEPPAGTVDAEVVDRAVADTDALIDSYLRGRYALPLAETPPALVPIALAIAIYQLHRFAPDPKIEQDYRDALASLDRIAKGLQRLPIDAIEPASSGAAGVQVVDRERPFTEANLKGFI